MRKIYKSPVSIYRFEEAPEAWQQLSNHGGDEDYLIYIPACYEEDWRLHHRLLSFNPFSDPQEDDHDPRWLHCQCVKLTGGGVVVITAHA